MSSEQSNISCAFCHAYLFEEDDVVYCPVCGAPYHRECYNTVGHCALEELHGTENQYDKLKQKQAEQEKEKQQHFEDSQTEQPKYQPFNQPFGNSVYIDFLGGVPKDYKLDEDVTADDAKNFVLSNTMRYIPKFARLSKQHKSSWNFMAFFFPCGWFLSRKMCKNGIIAGVFEIISSLLTIPFMHFLVGNDVITSTGQYDFQRIQEILPEMSPAIFVAAVAASLLYLSIRIICGIFGDYWYKVHTVNTIKKIKTESDDIETEYRQKGGVNLFLFFIGIMAVQYIPALIETFI